MTIKRVLKEQIPLVKPGDEDIKELENLSKDFIEELNSILVKSGIDAEAFVGGSFAKGTLVKKNKYDVDVFVRFDWRYDNISDLLEKPAKKVSKKFNLELERLHGSRDYFRAKLKNNLSYFELVPVTKIKKIHEERNVTDLSYFHVPYVKRKAKNIKNEILLAKSFFHAQKIYGAESYIQGFSGYALECLIIHFGSFEKMLKELVKVKIGERLVIDIEKAYGKKEKVFIEMNDSRLHSPVILVDPTYKERNALAALNEETFERFQKVAKQFLKKPTKGYFIEKKIDEEKLGKLAKKKKAEFLKVTLKTNKQKGDIAGTKLKKFSKVLESEIGRYFKILENEFDYGDEQSAINYLIVKSRKEVIRIGPPLLLKKHVRAFKKEHMNTYEKNKSVHAKIKINFGAKEFLDSWSKQRANKNMMKEMGITKLKI